jgi:hypothetical protein
MTQLNLLTQQVVPKAPEVLRLVVSGPAYDLPAGHAGLGAKSPKGAPQLMKGVALASSKSLSGLSSGFRSCTVATFSPSVEMLAGRVNDLHAERVKFPCLSHPYR